MNTEYFVHWFVRLEGPRRSAVDAIRHAAEDSVGPQESGAELANAWIDAYVGSYLAFDPEDPADGVGDVPVTTPYHVAALCRQADEQAHLVYSICLSAQDAHGSRVWAYLSNDPPQQGADPTQFCEVTIDRVAVAGAIGIAARTALNALAAALDATPTAATPQEQ